MDREAVVKNVTFTILGARQRVPVTLIYSRVDPYLVRAVFTAEGHEWMFSRELLHTAVKERTSAGIGDVQWYELDSVTLVMGLRSHDGEVALTIPWVDVAEFLRDSYAVVPRHAESEHLGIDAELVGLFCQEETL
jgi:hypothetical protein